MGEQAELAVFDGGTVRMFAGFARWRAMQAGLRSGRDMVVEQMLFDAGEAIRSGDLLAGFFHEDLVEMDWLEDFLCDPATREMMAELVAVRPEAEEEEEEMLYTKNMLVTIGTDMSEYS